MDKSKKPNQGQGKRGGRGGRGRGRGRGHGKFSFSRAFKKKTDSNLQKDPFDDDVDDIEQLDTDTLQRLEDNAVVLEAVKDLNLLQDLPGFDTTAGQVWVYPTNKPIRDYQYQIVQTALFHNTLICLPTGLGKTFVAAVIMFNFHRWYPNDKIIFMAPTTPLLTQQLDACLHSVGIHRSVTIEMTGTIQQKKRDELWKTKNVFFLTPQILESDIKRGTCPADQIRCIVVDEAHKALGNYAYAVVIQSLSKLSQHFRVIALSATPGTDSITVKKVLANLLISKLELRSEYSSEILPYIQDKKVEPVIVPLEEDGFLTSVHKKITEEFQFYTGKLLTLGVIPRNNVVDISSFQLLKLREMFRKNSQSGTDRRLVNQKGYIELYFDTCISLATAIERLLIYGLRVFYVFFEDVLRGNKMSNVGSKLRKNSNFEKILSSVQQKLKITLENSTFNMIDSGLSTSITTLQKKLIDTEETDYLLSHPKMKYLKNIVEQHFKTSTITGASTRIMIFSTLRDSVVEIAKMLCTLRPLVHPMVFYGQADSKTGDVGNRSKGLKQKEQQQILEEFKEGNFNTLISTSVGEEGLDIGDVDLIICYDSSNSSTELVQRMGRTVRRRDGKIIFLLTKGKEEQTYHASNHQNRDTNKQIMDPDILTPFLFPITPRMVPAGLNPECFKMNIIIPEEENDEDAFPIEEEDEEHLMTVNMDDFVAPVKKKPGKSTSISVKQPSKHKLTENNTVPIKRINNNDGKQERTLLQFLESMEKNKHMVKSTSSNDVVELITIDDDEHSAVNRTHSVRDTNNDVGGGLNNSGNSNKVCANSNISSKNVRNRSTGAKQKSGDDSSEPLEDNFVVLSALLDIKDYYGPSSSAPPCVFIPLPKEEKRNVLWKEEYNELPDSEFVISDVDLESMRERVDWSLLFGGVGCKCGNLVKKAVDVDDDNFNNNANKMDIDEFESYDDNFSIKNQEELSGKMNNLSIHQNQKNNNQFATTTTTTTTSTISTTSPSISDDYVPSFSYNPKNFIVKPEATTNTPTNTVATGITNNNNTTTNTFSTIRHPFRTTPNPSVLYNTPKDQRNWSPTPIKATSPPNIYKPLASTPVRHYNQSSNTVIERTISPDTIGDTSSANNNKNNNIVIQSKDSVVSPELQNFKINPKPRFSFKLSAQTSGGNNSNSNSLMNPPSSSGRVLKTPEELQITPMKKVSSESSPDLLVTPSPEFGLNRRRLNVKRRIINSGDTPPYRQNPTRKTSQTNGIKIRRNPFVLDEADQLDGDTSSGTDHDDKTDESKDTFVVDDDDDEEEYITGSQQQAMYIRSVKDVIPFRNGRIERPLSPRTTPRPTTKESSEYFDMPAEDYDEDYVNDSFCSDGVEFDDIGVFTQAMNVAKQQLDSEQDTKRKLRPRK